MASGLIGNSARPSSYTRYSIVTFPSWRALEDTAKQLLVNKPSGTVEKAKNEFRNYIEQQLRTANKQSSSYGMFGKAPKTFQEAMDRDKFIYYDEYKIIKAQVEKAVAKELSKDSVAEAMKPKLVFNDRQIGEFVFDKAAMSLVPEMFFYSPSKKRKVNPESEPLRYEGDKMYIVEDGSEVVSAYETEKPDGTFVYIPTTQEDALELANEIGVISCTSENRKVYLYKERIPRQYNAVKIIIGLSAGGFTRWTNDFYTGITAGVIVEVLESLGYAVDVEVAVGGGRCSGCYRKLRFDNQLSHGRRFFTFTAKSFDEPLDTDGLLYTLCDPSFHNIKFISLLNNFFNYFGDQIDTNGNPASTWHGIEIDDMTNPIGMYHKHIDYKKGNRNLLHFQIHRVAGTKNPEGVYVDVVNAVMNIARTAENINLKAYELSQNMSNQ